MGCWINVERETSNCCQSRVCRQCSWLSGVSSRFVVLLCGVFGKVPRRGEDNQAADSSYKLDAGKRNRPHREINHMSNRQRPIEPFMHDPIKAHRWRRNRRVSKLVEKVRGHWDSRFRIQGCQFKQFVAATTQNVTKPPEKILLKRNCRFTPNLHFPESRILTPQPPAPAQTAALPSPAPG